jgi:GNAT superfamily N-acetyltransferase
MSNTEKDSRPHSYRIRPATLDDVDALVHHRIGMFTDMGVPMDVKAVKEAFGRWLADVMPSGAYRAWVVEIDSGEVVAGGGATLIAWPPGPQHLGARIAFVYNVYTEPPHRRRGLARLIMDAIHGWCEEHGVTKFALNASEEGRPLYEAMGYRQTPNPMMFLTLEPGLARRPGFR